MHEITTPVVAHVQVVQQAQARRRPLPPIANLDTRGPISREDWDTPIETLPAIPFAPVATAERLIKGRHVLPQAAAEIDTLFRELTKRPEGGYGHFHTRKAHDFNRKKVIKQIIGVLFERTRGAHCACGSALSIDGDENTAKARLLFGALACPACHERQIVAAQKASEPNDIDDAA